MAKNNSLECSTPTFGIHVTERDIAYVKKIRDIYGESCVGCYLNEGYICDEDEINKYFTKLDEIISQKPSKEDFINLATQLSDSVPLVLL